MKHTLACMAFLLLLTACGSNEGGKDTQQQTSATAAETLSGNWYRQYEGTIAGKHVVVDMANYEEDATAGTYTYDEPDILLHIYVENDSSANGKLYIVESDPTNRDEDEHDNHWLVSVHNDSITGQWISYDGKKKYDIALKEVDYKSSYRFNCFFNTDSIVVPQKGFTVSAHITHHWCMPGDMATADKDFLNASVLKILGCKPPQNTDDCIKNRKNAYFANYKSQLEGDIPEEQSHTYNHDALDGISVMYNKNGLVILSHHYYEYMGGAHGMYGDTYTCLDVTNKREWQLGDVMTVDTNALSAILEAEARRIFKIPAAEAISERLLVDTIDPTENFYFTAAGIVFQYNAYEIASYADGEVSLFVPFSRLMAYLTPEFKKRMNLQG